MSLLDRIKYDATNNSEIVWKYPSDEIRLGSQLIVNQSQDAVFVLHGKAYDLFGPGTHTLTTANIPLLNHIVNIPFGKKTPFSAEVWYINKTVKRDLKWGTVSPIPLIDNKFNYPISVRAFGQWGYRISESRSFIEQIVGTLKHIDSDTIHKFFIGKILQTFSHNLSLILKKGNISIFDIFNQISELSDLICQDVRSELSLFGVDVVNIDIVSINIPDDEKKAIQEVMAKKMEIDQISTSKIGSAYTTMRSFDVIEKAAQTEGGGVGQMLGAGLGVGVGLGAGVPLGQQVSNNFNLGDESSPDSSDHEKTIVSKLKTLKNLYDDGLITEEDFTSRKNKLLENL